MEKKEGRKKKLVFIFSAVALLVLSVLFVVLYRNYTKTICVMEAVEHMGQWEGVSMDNILVEIEYWTITEGERRNNLLYIFENGDVYSAYSINYPSMGDTYNTEQNERENYYWDADDRYWDYLYGQYYLGRLSSSEVERIRREFSLIESYESYDNRYNEANEPKPDSETSPITQGNQTDSQGEDAAYYGHYYAGRAKESEEEYVRSWISRGNIIDGMRVYMYDEHAHNAIDIVKSTWAYEQWTNQIFGEGWKHRINLRDTLSNAERRMAGR